MRRAAVVERPDVAAGRAESRVRDAVMRCAERAGCQLWMQRRAESRVVACCDAVCAESRREQGCDAVMQCAGESRVRDAVMQCAEREQDASDAVMHCARESRVVGRCDAVCAESRVKRDAQSIAWNFGFIFLIIECLLFVAFGSPTGDIGTRTSVTLSLLLSAVAFKFVVKEDLPEVPYLTIMDKYMLHGFTMLFLQGMQNLVMQQIRTIGMSQHNAVRLDNICVLLFLCGLVIQHVHVWRLYYEKSKIMGYEEIAHRQRKMYEINRSKITSDVYTTDGPAMGDLREGGTYDRMNLFLASLLPA
ncbi:hypothetical protein CYMTET_26432 [Cymbomonas tetramitiformis]|uniref:Uncharacterized protein n=1 Tax=Cymbomonas tetramitiformis TaxID=36881 RepID=A0AAE0FSB1_9CHLO|nr:hypothetical protein CYMTET_26432 [Cymbomonas tetramitiformis]